MNYTRAVSVSRFILVILCIALVLSIAVCGVDSWGLGGIFESGTIRLGLDLSGGSIITYSADTEDTGETLAKGMDGILESMRTRLDAQGLTEANVYLVGDNMITLEIPSITDPNEAVETFGAAAVLTFRDADGNVTEVLCEYDPNSWGGDPADGRKVKGATLHWVDADNCLDAEVRLYDNLFSDPQPDGPDKNFLDCLNPDSLMVLRGCKVERSMAAVAEEFDRRENRTGVNAPTFQFMRTGYFCMDNRDCTAEHLVFNRSVSLKDSFKK